MRGLEIAAVILIVLGLVGLPAVALGHDALRHSSYDGQVITLAGEDGAWSQDTIRVTQGQKLRLRLTSNDVIHGFMLEGYGIDIDDVYPGKVKVVDLVLDKAGTFPFACTVPCSVNHRSMRGKLIVEAQGGSA